MSLGDNEYIYEWRLLKVDSRVQIRVFKRETQAVTARYRLTNRYSGQPPIMGINNRNLSRMA